MGSSSEHVVVYAIDRAADEPSVEAVDSVAVTAFHLGTSVQLDNLLTEAFHRVSVRLLSSVVGGRDLLVAETLDLGWQAPMRATIDGT